MRFDDIYKQLEAVSSRRIAVASPEDRDVLDALKQAAEMKIARSILVGNRSKIIGLLEDMNAEIDKFEIVDVPDASEVARICVNLINEGSADLLMKGKVPTASLMKAVLDKENGLRTGRVLSHIAITQVSSYPKLMFFTDGGINIDQGTDVKCDIIRNAVESCRRLGIKEPRVALLTLVENVNPKLPETEIAAEIRHLREKGEFPDTQIEGPIALDVALSRRAAEKKGIESSIAGETDIFVGANITATNHIVKALVELAGARVGGVIVGARVPVILLSRSDSSRIKLDSIAAAVALSSSGEL